tara:strand:+ start:3284 stop:3994 length:711 start_codon:yes stop_codon:yes gene_type:complete
MLNKKYTFLSSIVGALLLSGTVHADNIYRTPFKANIEIEANSSGVAVSLPDDQEDIREKNSYNYATDSWGESGDYYWLDHTGACGMSLTDTHVSATHGSSMCYTALGNKSKETYQEFVIKPSDNFKISFNAYKTSRGSNYRSNAFFRGSDGTDLFYWRYHRDGADYFRTPVGSVGISEGSDRRYTLEKIGSRMKMYVDGALVGEGEYAPAVEKSYRLYLAVNNSRMHLRDLEVSID